MAYESPPYQVVQKEGAFELRRYESFYTSSVQENRMSGESGFSVLFSYISGENASQQPMAMTVPVINELQDQTMTMEFVIPRQFYGNQIPQPTRRDVTIKHYPEQWMATMRFSGSLNQTKLNSAVNALNVWIEKLNLTTISPLRMARYNSPFSLPMFRRNEILFSVEPKQK